MLLNFARVGRRVADCLYLPGESLHLATLIGGHYERIYFTTSDGNILCLTTDGHLFNRQLSVIMSRAYSTPLMQNEIAQSRLVVGEPFYLGDNTEAAVTRVVAVKEQKFPVPFLDDYPEETIADDFVEGIAALYNLGPYAFKNG